MFLHRLLGIVDVEHMLSIRSILDRLEHLQKSSLHPTAARIAEQIPESNRRCKG